MKLTKNKLRKIFEPMSRSDRMNICKEIYPLVDQVIQQNRMIIPAVIQQECVYVHSKALHTGKINWRNLAKLYLVAESNPRELQHWCMSGNSLYRAKNFHKGKSKNTRHRITTRTRRPSIVGWSDDTIPRTFIEKHFPAWVQTQKDYDHYMQDKLGFDREEFWRRLKTA